MVTTNAAAWATTSITRALNLQYPIIQAPCAGHTGAELIAAVSNAGGLGSLGAGMIPTDQLRTTIQAIRSRTSNAFAVNLFCRPNRPPTAAELQKHYPGTDDILNSVRSELNIPIPTEYKLRSPDFDEQVTVLLEERVPVVSFTFGLLPDNVLQRFWSAGTYLIGTATTVQEAMVLAGLDSSDPTRKADAIVAQGLEAGGHRGSFLKGKGPNHEQKTTAELVKAIKSAHNSNGICRFPVPVIAAGGISTGQDVYTALADWKSDGVSIGTLFMLSAESTTPKAHREYILDAQKNNVEGTKITTTITGKSVRSYPNKLMKLIEQVDAADIPTYEIHSSKTKDIAAYASKNNLTDYMLLLTGANASVAAEYSEKGTLSASEILNKLVADVDKLAV